MQKAHATASGREEQAKDVRAFKNCGRCANIAAWKDGEKGLPPRGIQIIFQTQGSTPVGTSHGACGAYTIGRLCWYRERLCRKVCFTNVSCLLRTYPINDIPPEVYAAEKGGKGEGERYCVVRFTTLIHFPHQARMQTDTIWMQVTSNRCRASVHLWL